MANSVDVRGLTAAHSGCQKSLGHYSDDYSSDVNLGCGYSLSLDWDKVDEGWYFRGRKQGPRHTCGDKDYRNCAAIGPPLLEPYAGLADQRTWSNGTFSFRPDFSSDACLESLKDAENITIKGSKLVPTKSDKPGRFVVEMTSPYVTSKASIRIKGGMRGSPLRPTSR